MIESSQPGNMLEEMKKMTGETGNSTPVFNTLPWRTRGDFLRKWGLKLSYGFLGFDQNIYDKQLKNLWELSTSGGNSVDFNESEYNDLIANIDSVTKDCVNIFREKIPSNFSLLYKDELQKNLLNPLDWQYKLIKNLKDFQTNVCINKTDEINAFIKHLEDEYYSKFTEIADLPINVLQTSGNTCFIDSMLVAILANPTKLLREKLTEFYKDDTNLSKYLKNIDDFINKENDIKLGEDNVKQLASNLSVDYVNGSMNDPTEFLMPLFDRIKLNIEFTNTVKKKIDDDLNTLETTEVPKEEHIFYNIYGLVKSKTEKNDLSKIITENFKSVTFEIGTTPSNKNVPYITTTTTTISPPNAPLYIHTQPNLRVTEQRNERTMPLILSEFVTINDYPIYELRSIVVYVSLNHYVCFFKDTNNIWWLYDDLIPRLQKFNNFQEVLSHPNKPQENCVLLCYECLLSAEEFGVDSTPNTAQVLASGGFGMVVADGNIARKLMYSKTTCDAAAIEYHNITTLYNAFERARNSSQNRAVSAALHTLKPLVPRGFLKEPFEFSIGTNVERFSCQLLTDRIPGLSTLRLPHDNIVAAAQQYFPEILVMPVFEFKSQLSLRNPNESPDPERNFPRYYISNMDEVGKIYPTINFLHEFPYAMGVLLAVFVFEAKLSMMDVKILLGGDMNTYIVDLGMCKDISEIVNSGDLYELSAILTDISGPFYTKNSFPLPTNEPQYGSFSRGLWDAGVEMGVTTEFLQLFLEQLHYDLT
jgi:hypothetical protein